MVNRRPTEEIARLGDAIYERDIRREVEADHHGEVVAIDIDSECWAIGDTLMAARDRLRAERPDAVNVLFERVGYRTIDRFGAGFPRSAVAVGAGCPSGIRTAMTPDSCFSSLFKRASIRSDRVGTRSRCDQ